MVKRMDIWMLFIFLSFTMYGMWAFLPKIASRHLDAKTILVFETIGTIAIVLVLFASMGLRASTHRIGVPVAILAGACGALGSLFFLLALAKGNTSVVVTATALYPLLVIVLSAVFLKEAMTVTQGIGIVFAIAAMILFSMK
jgi:transporter family protein